MDKLEERDCIMFDLYNAWKDGRIRHRVVHERRRYGLHDVGCPCAVLTDVTLNRSTGTSMRRELPTLHLEVRKINPQYVATRTHFQYRD